MYLIAGLGNPGDKYKFTRHNAGFLTVAAIAERHNIPLSTNGFNAIYGKGKICGKDVILALPQTFMNNSGDSIRAIMNFYKITPEDLIVIYDDMDIDVGSIRIRLNGSAGTHNGMKSIILDNLHTEEFRRIRIGIGRPKYHDAINYVLSDFTEEETPLLKAAIADAADAMDLIMSRGTDFAMNRFNKKKKPPKETIQ